MKEQPQINVMKPSEGLAAGWFPSSASACFPHRCLRVAQAMQETQRMIEGKQVKPDPERLKNNTKTSSTCCNKRDSTNSSPPEEAEDVQQSSGMKAYHEWIATQGGIVSVGRGRLGCARRGWDRKFRGISCTDGYSYSYKKKLARTRRTRLMKTLTWSLGSPLLVNLQVHLSKQHVAVAAASRPEGEHVGGQVASEKTINSRWSATSPSPEVEDMRGALQGPVDEVDRWASLGYLRRSNPASSAPGSRKSSKESCRIVTKDEEQQQQLKENRKSTSEEAVSADTPGGGSSIDVSSAPTMRGRGPPPSESEKELFPPPQFEQWRPVEGVPPPPPPPPHPAADPKRCMPAQRAALSIEGDMTLALDGNVGPGVLSLGTAGHPSTCAAEACRYVKRKGGCRDGAACPKCHLCFWRKRDTEDKEGLCSAEAGAASTSSRGGALSFSPTASLGSFGHPFQCSAPCRYVRRKGGCRDGARCENCHICVWCRDRSGSSCTSSAAGSSVADMRDLLDYQGIMNWNRNILNRLPGVDENRETGFEGAEDIAEELLNEEEGEENGASDFDCPAREETEGRKGASRSSSFEVDASFRGSCKWSGRPNSAATARQPFLAQGQEQRQQPRGNGAASPHAPGDAQVNAVALTNCGSPVFNPHVGKHTDALDRSTGSTGAPSSAGGLQSSWQSLLAGDTSSSSIGSPRGQQVQLPPGLPRGCLPAPPGAFFPVGMMLPCNFQGSPGAFAFPPSYTGATMQQQHQTAMFIAGATYHQHHQSGSGSPHAAAYSPTSAQLTRGGDFQGEQTLAANVATIFSSFVESGGSSPSSIPHDNHVGTDHDKVDKNYIELMNTGCADDTVELDETSLQESGMFMLGTTSSCSGSASVCSSEVMAKGTAKFCSPQVSQDRLDIHNEPEVEFLGGVVVDKDMNTIDYFRLRYYTSSAKRHKATISRAGAVTTSCPARLRFRPRCKMGSRAPRIPSRQSETTSSSSNSREPNLRPGHSITVASSPSSNPGQCIKSLPIACSAGHQGVDVEYLTSKLEQVAIVEGSRRSCTGEDTQGMIVNRGGETLGPASGRESFEAGSESWVICGEPLEASESSRHGEPLATQVPLTPPRSPSPVSRRYDVDYARATATHTQHQFIAPVVNVDAQQAQRQDVPRSVVFSKMRIDAPAFEPSCKRGSASSTGMNADAPEFVFRGAAGGSSVVNICTPSSTSKINTGNQKYHDKKNDMVTSDQAAPPDQQHQPGKFDQSKAGEFKIAASGFKGTAWAHLKEPKRTAADMQEVRERMETVLDWLQDTSEDGGQKPRDVNFPGVYGQSTMTPLPSPFTQLSESENVSGERPALASSSSCSNRGRLRSVTDVDVESSAVMSSVASSITRPAGVLSQEVGAKNHGGGQGRNRSRTPSRLRSAIKAKIAAELALSPSPNAQVDHTKGKQPAKASPLLASQRKNQSRRLDQRSHASYNSDSDLVVLGDGGNPFVAPTAESARAQLMSMASLPFVGSIHLPPGYQASDLVAFTTNDMRSIVPAESSGNANQQGQLRPGEGAYALTTADIIEACTQLGSNTTFQHAGWGLAMVAIPIIPQSRT
ncbi:unnamed protein product [Amoebophrya sp. A25]|nr:unnamed protein product [Amoebophrya sp. A25]|eukprot:GSA25T00001015001.1